MKRNFVASLFITLLVTLFLTSCGSVKNVAYLQNSNFIDFEQSKYLYDARIMPKDILTITVNTVDPDAAAPFNLTIAPEMTNSQGRVRLSTGGRTLQTYLVDNQGCIEFPILGVL